MKIKFDKDGNRCLSVTKNDLGGACGFSVQTLPYLPETHHNGICEHTEKELKQYVEKYGSKREKRLFGLCI